MEINGLKLIRPFFQREQSEIRHSAKHFHRAAADVVTRMQHAEFVSHAAPNARRTRVLSTYIVVERNTGLLVELAGATLNLEVAKPRSGAQEGLDAVRLDEDVVAVRTAHMDFLPQLPADLVGTGATVVANLLA